MTITLNLNKTQWNSVFKFVNKKETREALRGVYFTNKYLTATDSKRIIFIFDDFSKQNGLILNKDYEKIDVVYPNTDKFLQYHFDELNPNKFVANVNELLNIHKELLPFAKHEDEKGNNKLTMNIESDSKVSFVCPKFKKELNIDITNKDYFSTRAISYNCKYMIDALNVFKSFKYQEVKIFYRQSDKPVELMSLDGKIKILIMPIVTF